MKDQLLELLDLLPRTEETCTNMRSWLRAAALCAVAVAAVSGTELTKDNYEEVSAGKVAFIKFFAPWCSRQFRTPSAHARASAKVHRIAPLKIACLQVWPLQIHEASLGQAYGRVQGQQGGAHRRLRLHRRLQVPLRGDRRAGLSHVSSLRAVRAAAPGCAVDHGVLAHPLASPRTLPPLSVSSKVTRARSRIIRAAATSTGSLALAPRTDGCLTLNARQLSRLVVSLRGGPRRVWEGEFGVTAFGSALTWKRVVPCHQQSEEACGDQAQALVLPLQPAPLRRRQEGRGACLCTDSCVCMHVGVRAGVLGCKLAAAALKKLRAVLRSDACG